MLDPFVQLQHTGFSQRESADSRGSWTPDLIAGLDWMRLGELLRAIAAHAKCELGPSRVQADGSIQFAMVEGPKTRAPQRTVVKLTAWNQWGATPACVEMFAQELSRIREKCRGVLVAPGGFTSAALSTAAAQRIEAIDAHKLHATLHAMPPQESDFFYTITTAGHSRTPTCPLCMRRLSRVEQPAAHSTPSPSTVLVFQSSTMVAEPVLCRRLEVMRGCEVTFLHDVRAQEIIIHGHASGDIVCEGPLTLEAGATLSGSVSSRSIIVREGAELLAKARILEGILAPHHVLEAHWFWRCQNPAGTEQCRSIAFEPHE